MPGGWFGGATEAWAPTNAQKQAEEEEARELDELHALLGRGEGALSRGVFLKLQVAQENRAKADEARAERQEVMRQIEMRAREQTVRIQKLRMLTKDRDTEAVEAAKQMKVENARQMRALEKERMKQRDEIRKHELDIARARAVEARGLDARLDAQAAQRASKASTGLTTAPRRPPWTISEGGGRSYATYRQRQLSTCG